MGTDAQALIFTSKGLPGYLGIRTAPELVLADETCRGRDIRGPSVSLYACTQPSMHEQLLCFL